MRKGKNGLLDVSFVCFAFGSWACGSAADWDRERYKIIGCQHSECEQGSKLSVGCGACVGTVCQIDSFCCNVFWDSLCVSEAKSLCNTCGSESACAHSECESGLKLGFTCSACTAIVCGPDPYCCNIYWDSICVGEAKSWCDVCDSDPISCHSEYGVGPAMDESCSQCVGIVCSSDPYCCNNYWDGICVSEAESFCTVEPELGVIDTGYRHACSRLTDGSIKCWGGNADGMLGLGDNDARGDSAGEMGGNLPAVDLGMGHTAIAVAAGEGHSCAVLDDGSVKCWGASFLGQLGLGDTAIRGEEPGEMGDALPQVDLGTGQTAVSLSAAAYATCALLDTGSVKCWGDNEYGALGVNDREWRGDEPGEMGDNLPAVNLGTGRTALSISAGRGHVCALLDNDTVKCWGVNQYGQLGQGNLDNWGDGCSGSPCVPPYTIDCSMQLDEMGDNLPPVALGTGRSAVAISSGGYHTCALLDNGTIKCWGAGSLGQLGLNDRQVRGDGPGEMGDNLPAVNLGVGRNAVAISAGEEHTCAILDDGSVKCWGVNTFGALGLGDEERRGDGCDGFDCTIPVDEMGDNLPPVDLGTGRTAVFLSAGGLFTCVVLDNGAIKCWGDNNEGQLGLGDTLPRGDQPAEMGDALPPVVLY